MNREFQIGPVDDHVVRIFKRRLRIAKHKLQDRPKSRTPLIGAPGRKPALSNWRGCNAPKARTPGCF